MPLAQNFNAFLGAAVLGVIGAAGLFLVEHYRHDRQRKMMARDLARLDQEMRNLRIELVQLQSQSSKSIRSKRANKRSRTLPEETEEHLFNYSKANSIISTTTDDYLSASNFGDSSDQEFYDISDDEVDISGLTSSLENVCKGNTVSTKKPNISYY